MNTNLPFVLILFNVLFFNYAYTQTTHVPDDVFEQYLIDQGYDTAPLDDYVPTANIENVTAVILYNTNVTDLTGIEDFLALETLDVPYTSISSLDVSNNTALTKLYADNTSISSLDVSNNTALTYLFVYGTSISSLDVSNNTALTILYADNTANLNCITVADAVAAEAGTGIYNGWVKDTSCIYSENCSLEGLTYVPDDVFEQYLIDQGYDTAPLDDYVPTANIENVTSVILYNTNVTDLTGIEDFLALETLDVANTSISSLDVSNNTALTYLYVYNTSISSLDVSNNTALTFLDAYGTSISSLDVSNNTALTSLIVYGTSISSLDVSNNTALTSLYVNNTSISSLDVSNNTALTYLYVHNTSISSLDVSNNTALTSLFVYDTPISSLDVSNNTALTYLRVYNTSISSLDVSNNTALTFLYTENTANLNCITVADAVAAEAGTGIYNYWFKDTPCIYSENCSLEGLTYVPDDVFEQYLIDQGYDTAPLDDYVPTANIENVTSVILYNTNVTDLTGIEDFLALETLDVANTSISSLDVSNNTALTYLSVYDTPISSLDVSNNTALTRLNADGTSISSLDVSNNTALTFLYTENTANLNCITVADAVAAEAGTGIYNYWFKDTPCIYSENCSLEGLTYVPDDVFEQYLIDQGYDTAPLDDYVPTANIENVTSVILYNTNVTDLTGIEDFLALETLDVANTSISSLDVSNNTSLTRLYADNTSISSLDVSNNTALTYLYVYNTPINSLDVSNNTALTRLNADGTSISSLDVSNNTALTFLYAENTANLNCITVADAVAAEAGTGIYNYWFKDTPCIYSEDCSTLSTLNFDTAIPYLGPNPVKDELVIRLSHNTILTDVQLFDITGKLVLKSTDTNISTNRLKSGIYLIKVNTSKGAIMKKLIKQ